MDGCACSYARGLGLRLSPCGEKMYAVYRAFEQERAKSWTNIPKELLVGYPREKLLLHPASSGVSMTQQDYRVALMALGVLVALVLLIACANVANLMTAQAASRAREMALRVSIGAGRSRLVQMVMVESAMLALFASGLGAVFAWWAAPFVVNSISTPGNPVRLILPADWRVARIWIASDPGGYTAVRADAGPTRVVGQARERTEGRRRSTCASSPHAWVDCGAGRILFCCALPCIAVYRNLKASFRSTAGLFSRSALAFGYCYATSAAGGSLGRDGRESEIGAGGGSSCFSQLAAVERE